MATDVEILDMAERWDEEPKGVVEELKYLRKLIRSKNYGDQPGVYHLVDILIKHFGEKVEICPNCKGTGLKGDKNE